MFKSNVKQALKKSYVYTIYCLLLKDKVESYRVMKAKKELQVNGRKIIKCISDGLEQENVVFFVNFGSLLGLVRDQKFMSYDCDMDFGVFINDLFTWEDLERVLRKCGAYKTKQFSFNNEITEQSYRIGHLDIDFFRYFVDGENAYQYFYYRESDKKYDNDYDYDAARLNVKKISGVKKVMIGEDEFFIPNEPELYLASIYTKEWRIPDPHWDHRKGPSFEALTGKFGKAKYFI